MPSFLFESNAQLISQLYLTRPGNAINDMSALRNPLIQEFLNLLEGKEIKLLSWGIVDGGFAEEEIAEMAAELLSNNEPDVDIWDLINEILERRLLFELNLRGRRLTPTISGTLSKWSVSDS